MSSRSLGFAAVGATLALVLAQYAAPAWTGFHTWGYATALFVAAMVMLAYVNGARKGEDGETGRRLIVAFAGALVIGAAGLASGLLGPDTETVSRAPGQVAPLPDVGVAAFFPNAGAGDVERGDASVILRSRDGASTVLGPGAKHVAGAAELEVQPRLAAFVEAFDDKGNHLTITQPTNPAFLSPVLTFPQNVEIAQKSLPSDAFATPAVHRQVRVFYFSAANVPQAGPHSTGGKPALLFSVDDDRGLPIPGGIAFATDGSTIEVGGLRLRATIGTYPSIAISAVPYPLAVAGGVVALLFGLWYARPRSASAKRFGSSVPASALALLAFAGATLLGGCTRLGAGTGGTLHPWIKPDTLRIGFYEEPDSLNPVISSMAFTSDVGAMIYDGLIKYDSKGRPIPDLATEVPSLQNGGISKDGLTITYHLIENAKWSDGVPLTSRDVLFTYRAIMNSANNTPTREGYDRIAKIEAPDAHTVRLHFKTPYPPAVYLFKDLNQGFIVPEHVLGGFADVNRVPFNTRPVGSGPYVLRTWEHGSRMLFDRNPHYFGAPAKIPHVEISFVPDQNTMANELRAHDIDLYLNVPLQQYRDIAALPDVAVAQTSTLHWEHLNFNTQAPPLDERAVRLALCYATDEASIFAKIYHGLGRSSPVHFNPDFGWGDPSIAYYPYDLKKAAALLEAAGWKRGADGIRYRDGRPLAVAISTVAGVKNREAIEVVLQAAWRSIGVDATVKNYPASTLFAPRKAGGVLFGGKTDVAIFTWQNTTPDPDDEAYISPKSLPPNGENTSFYVNQKLYALEEAGLRSFDPAVRRPSYFADQKILIDQVPEYVFDFLPEIDAFDTDLHGVEPNPVGSDLTGIATWEFK